MGNKKKVLLLFLVMIVSFAFSMTVLAGKEQRGRIEIVLTEGENVTFEYAKVADLINGEYHMLQKYEKSDIELNGIVDSSKLGDLAQKLNEYVVEGEKVTTDEKGKAYVENLEAGAYLLRASDEANSEYAYPVLISVPTWNEEEESMNYDITVIPKRSSDKVVTGDEHLYGEYMAIFGISFILLVGLTCHNHFGCGKIAGNYSEKGGHTHGNDNDTKNSRRSRRIRSCSGRSID